MSEQTQKYDFGIIGAGPAGYTAAIRASQLGKSVVLFEKEHLGGVCLNKGCIPTKSYLFSADLFNSIKKASSAGIEVGNAVINFEKVYDRKNKIVEKLRKSLEQLLKSYEIQIINAEAKILPEETAIEADSIIYKCDNIIVATGSKPQCIKGFEFDHKFILNSDDILELKTLPKNIAIIGSGAIGIEWARIFSAFGTEVSIVEIADRLLPLADIEISQRLEKTLKMAKVKTYLSTSVSKIQNKKLELSSGEALEADLVLMATGRAPLTKEIDYTSKAKNIHIIGDAHGEVQLAHFASHQAVSTIESIILSTPKNEFLVPAIVYGNPEIAWVGETEQELLRKNIEYKKSNFPISALGKAQTEGNLEGFVKILSSDDKILGAHIISKDASSLIHQFLIAMQNGISAKELKKCCFAHPTYSEAIYESILCLDNISLTLLRGKNEK